MTDKDIIKALECCSKPLSENCKECPLCSQDCLDIDPCELALDLISRLQEENENYSHNIKQLTKEIEEIRIGVQSFKGKYKNALQVIREKQSVIESFTDIGKMYSEIKAEAIKEFAERLKAETIEVDVSYGYGREHYTEAVAVIVIDNLVKEMVGEDI